VASEPQRFGRNAVPAGDIEMRPFGNTRAGARRHPRPGTPVDACAIAAPGWIFEAIDAGR
jgi:hypothetical protein